MSGTRIGWQLALPILDEIGQILTLCKAFVNRHHWERATRSLTQCIVVFPILKACLAPKEFDALGFIQSCATEVGLIRALVL